MRRRTVAPLIAGWILVGALVPTAAAQRDSTRTDTTRKATRLPDFQVVAERPRAAPPAVTTVDVPAARLRRTESRNSYDLIRRTAGIEVHEQGQGPGFASDVVLRGFSSDHSADVLLTIDGVPINLPIHGHVEGYADWSILSPAAVTSVRVISGTASPLYGDFALGGVVEVFTAADAVGVTGAVSGSSDGDGGGWLRIGHRSADRGYLAALDGTRQQGWRAHSAYWLGNGLLRGWRQLGSGRLEGGLALYGSSWDSPGFVSVAQFNARDFQTPSDSTDGGSANRIMAHGRVTDRWGSVGVDGSLWLQHVRSSVFLNIPEDGLLSQTDEEDRRLALGGRLQLARPTGRGDLSWGIDGRADRATYDLWDTDRRVIVGPSKQLDGRYAQGGGFVRWRNLVGSKLAVDLGARADLVHYRSRNRLTGADWAENTELVLGPKLGARWLTGSGWSIQGSLSRGFRGAPGMIEDATLPPITAWTKEVGLRFDGERTHLQLAAFRLDVSHERIQDPITREITNTGGSLRQGVNLDLDLSVTGRLAILADATVNDARISRSNAAVITPSLAVGDPPTGLLFHIEPAEPGDPVPNVARYVGRIGFEWQASRAVTTRAAVRFSGPYTPIGEPAVRTQAYSVIDVGGAWHSPWLGATLGLDLTNLLSTKYPEIRSSGFLNPGAPRTLRLSIRFADGT